MCCQTEISASERYFGQKSPTERGVSEYNREAWTKMRPWTTSSFHARGKKEVKPSCDSGKVPNKTAGDICTIPSQRWNISTYKVKDKNTTERLSVQSSCVSQTTQHVRQARTLDKFLEQRCQHELTGSIYMW